MRVLRAAAAALCVLVLSSCGGGGEAAHDILPPLARASVARDECTRTAVKAGTHKLVGNNCLRSSTALKQPSMARRANVPKAAAAAAATGPLTATELMDWAEATYPTLFPAGDRHTGALNATVHYRNYPSKQNVVAIASEGGLEGVYLFGAVTGYQVSYMGLVSDFTCAVRNPCTQVGTGKLLLQEVGVALASTPAWSRLNRTITLRDTAGGGASWTATSDQSWLTVTSSGSTGSNGTGAITVTANPASLQSDKVHIATVTLVPSSPGVTAPEKLVVGLWKGSTTPTEKVAVKAAYTRAAADPVRPYVYVHNGSGTVDVYNVYKQSLEASIPNVGGVLGSMAVAADGSKLFALDTANRAVAVIDLKTRAVLPAMELGFIANPWTGLAYGRPDGTGMLFLSDQSIYQVSPWNMLDPGSDYADYHHVAVNVDSSQVGYVGYSSAPAYSIGVTMNELHVDYVGSGVFTNGADVAFSRDGKRFYTAAGNPYRCDIWDATNGSAFGALPADAYPGNVEVASDGRVYCGRSSAFSDEPEIWVYSAMGTLLKTLKVTYTWYHNNMTDLLDRQFVVSGDGLVGFAVLGDTYYNTDSHVVFVPIGP